MTADDLAPDNLNEEREGRYANHFYIGHNAFEVVLQFGQLYEGDRRALMHTKIVTSPAYALTLLQLLREAMAQYETRFGSIPAGNAHE